MIPLYLASASPRRAELLSGLGVAFKTVAPRIDETALAGETPPEHVVRLAAQKAASVAAALRDQGIDALVLAADTVVALDGAILGKPKDDREALAMLRRLAGRRHEVLTACRLVRIATGSVAACLAVTAVRFAPFNEPLARWYVGTGEPRDKAGAYGIQGLGVFLSEGIEGSWSNVVGLPLEELPAMFHEAGDDLLLRMEHPRTG